MHGYTLLKKVAEGAAAEAYLARSEDGRPVLLEVSRAEVVHDTELYGRYLDTAQGRKSFTHPNLLARTNTQCGEDGRVYVITEPIGGPTLAEHLAAHGALGVGRALQWLQAITSAVGYLHSRSVVHGHLSPRHVYLAGDPAAPTPKLLETGLLLFRTTRSVRTPASLVLVRPEYLSPERAAGKRGDRLSDLYGLGVLFYEMLVGHPPFLGEQARRMHIEAQPPPLPEACRPVAALVSRLLAKDPHHRPQNARELELELASLSAELDAPIPLGPPKLPLALGLPRSVPVADFEISVEPPQAELPSPRPSPLERDGESTQSLRPLDPPTPAPQLLGPYQVLRALGEGGMGRVFLARHVHLDREVAIKVLKPNFAADPVATRRFLLEARTAHRVKDPHLLEVFDFLEDDRGRFCCVMEPLKGETLRARGSKEVFPVHRVVKIARQVCEALSALHAAGVVHRDVKPDNVFLIARGDERDYVKLFDLGIARVLGDRTGELELTRQRQVVGTPAYMAPEQAVVGPIDARADLYALATLIYVMLCGRFPFDAVSSEEMMETKVRERPRQLPARAASGEEVPKALRKLIGRCLEPDPDRRVSSAKELADLLEPFERAPAEAAVPRSSRRLPLLLGLLGLAAAGAGLDVFLNLPAQPSAAAPAAQPAPVPAPSVAKPAEPKPAEVKAAVPVPDVPVVEITSEPPITTPAVRASPVHRAPAPAKKTYRRRNH